MPSEEFELTTNSLGAHSETHSGFILRTLSSVNSQDKLTLLPCCELSESLQLTPWTCSELFVWSSRRAHLNISPWGMTVRSEWANTVSSLLPLIGELIGIISRIVQCKLTEWVANFQKAHSKLTVWAYFVSSLWAKWESSKWARCEFQCELLVG